MTSMFDQYEQAYQKFKNIENSNVQPQMTTSGYLQMKLEDEVPIFSKKKLNFTPSDRITHLVVANDYLVLAMANNLLFRIDLTSPENNEEISLSKYVTNSRLKHLFLDPLGQHLLLSFGPSGVDGTSELLYLPRKSSKLRPTTKFRNHEITAVAWNFANDSDSTTNSILLGSSKGLIFETEIGFDGDKIFQTGIEQYWRQVFDIGKGQNVMITGLEFHRVPNTDRYFIIVTTPNRFYQFIGNANSDEKPLLQQIFNSYLNVQEKYQKIKSSLNYSKLQFFYSQPRGLPKKFAWLTEPGIYYGELDPYGRESIDLVINIKNLIQYPEQTDVSTNYKPTNAPLNFVITEFNALLLYNDNIKIVSLLNNELISDDNYPEKIVNIAKDPVRGTIWVFTEHTIYRYKIYKEERNVWQIYCNQNNFDLAKKYCQDNPAHYDQVLIKQAEVFFEKGDYFESAKIYADTQSSSFEEICLKFLNINKFDALKIFLRRKLEKLKIQDKTQITLIVLWITEIYLKQLGEVRNKEDEKSEVYTKLQKDFEEFLSTKIVMDCVKNNKQIIYDLMASHGDQENLVKLTIANKDYEQVIRQHIYKNNYIEALEILKSQMKRELFYQFVPTLLQEIPKRTVTVLIQQGKNLSPVKLLPALVGCDNDELHINEILRYLEHCVFSMGTTERAIHNYLLSLYANYRPEEKFKNYLTIQGQDSSMVFYDVYYALRLCEERGLTESCVQLSAMLGLWESAVDLALKINIDLAKQVANMPESNNELKKKLWLKIARHVVSRKNDIKGAMEFLQQCDLIKIEDVLPFFSDFDTIDHFKDAICTSLQFVPTLLQEIPKRTVTVLIQQGKNLSPVKLLPALVGCDNDELHINEILRYLEHCVFSMGTTERAIHNYLPSLYANYRPEEKFKNYLTIQGQVNHTSASFRRMDFLRGVLEFICKKHFFYITILQKRTKYLKKLDLEKFLNEYNQHIQDLKEEMEEATKASEIIREEIQQFRNRCAIIQADDTCAICNLTLMVRPFYYFPCTHKFHSDCLIAELTPLLGSEKQSELAELNRRLTQLNTKADNISTSSASLSQREQIKCDIDNIIASECIYCGSYMINEIDKPFVDDKEFELVLKDWL